jgi:hypothetical protein
MKASLTVLKMEAADPELGDIGVDYLRPAHDAQQNVRCDIVAERSVQPQKLAQRHINPAVRILILQRALDVGQDAVLREEPHKLIQRKLALLYLVQDRESERQLED